MIRIGIVDDHVLIREGVKKILQKTSDMEVIAETDNIPQLLRLIPDSDLHVLVLDISIPGHSGLDALAEVKKRWPQLPVKPRSRSRCSTGGAARSGAAAGRATAPCSRSRPEASTASCA
jgi:chemotaxis response regulator CheB